MSNLSSIFDISNPHGKIGFPQGGALVPVHGQKSHRTGSGIVFQRQFISDDLERLSCIARFAPRSYPTNPAV